VSPMAPAMSAMGAPEAFCQLRAVVGRELEHRAIQDRARGSGWRTAWCARRPRSRPRRHRGSTASARVDDARRAVVRR
jgi:hypothetical protein